MPGLCAVLPLLASAAGTGMQMAANAQAERAMNRKVQQELARQAQYQQQAGQLYQASAQQSTPQVAAQQTGAGATARQGAYEQAQSVPLSMSSAAPATTGTQQLSSQASTGQSNVARSKNAAYDDWLLAQMIKNLRAQQSLGVMSNFARGSQGVMPYEIQQAQYTGQGLRNAGQLTNAAGSLTGSGLCG